MKRKIIKGGVLAALLIFFAAASLIVDASAAEKILKIGATLPLSVLLLSGAWVWHRMNDFFAEDAKRGGLKIGEDVQVPDHRVRPQRSAFRSRCKCHQARVPRQNTVFDRWRDRSNGNGGAAHHTAREGSHRPASGGARTFSPLISPIPSDKRYPKWK